MTKISKLQKRGLVREIAINKAVVFDGKVVAMEYWVSDMPDGRGWHSYGNWERGELLMQLFIPARGILCHWCGVVCAREDLTRVKKEIIAEYNLRRAKNRPAGPYGILPAQG